MNYFDVDLFLKAYSKRIKTLETGQISEWSKCSIRYVQKGASTLDIPYKRIHGRKIYIWNEDDLRRLAIWLNRKSNRLKLKADKIELKNRNKKPVRKVIAKIPQMAIKKKNPEKPKLTVPFKTIREYVIENFNLEEWAIKGRIRDIQKWAGINRVPFMNMYGRKYYQLTDELFKKYMEHRLTVKSRKPSQIKNTE